MIVVDTSVIIAIAFAEVEARRLALVLQRSVARRISAANHLEATMVVEGRKGPMAQGEVDRFLHDAGIEVMPFDRDQLRLAQDCFRRFGRGRHPAGLNFGDCFAYALARAQNAPLLFKGDDFHATDIEVARY
ncbi:MAG: type II toxin-antitoxin system VapC family toxin [Geminicoccaceae bacterium]|nr:type II toxin-antitoxin system VapC family toxin [Geminicoccaceae bacterium]